MILFLYGQDTYRSRKKLKEIIEQYKKVRKSGLNLQYFDLGEKRFEDFSDSLRHSPMFKEKKLFVVSGAFSNSDFCKRFLKEKNWLVNSEDIIVFYQEEEVSPKNGLFKFLKEQVSCQEFKPLSGIKLKQWVGKEAGSYGLGIDSRALDALINFVGRDLWQMSNEIKKLAAYKNKIKEAAPTIIKDDVEALVRPKIETDIFKTIDAIGSKRKKSALALLRQHLEKGDSPLYLLAMLSYQFRNLLSVKELLERGEPYYMLGKKTKLHPFVLRKALDQTSKFTLAELKKIYQRLFETDLAIKTGRIEPELALDLLIADM